MMPDYYDMINNSINALLALKDDQSETNDKFIMLVHPDKIKEVKIAVKHYDDIKHKLKIKKRIPINLFRLLLYWIKYFIYLLLDKIGFQN